MRTSQLTTPAQPTELQKMAFRLTADLDHTMRSWALAETSCLFQFSNARRYRRFCIQEQATIPVTSPIILQIGLNAWRETALGILRLTDLGNNLITVPRLKEEISAIGDLADLAQKHRDFVLISQLDREREALHRRLRLARDFVVTNSYSRKGKSEPDIDCKLWRLRTALYKIRGSWLAHLKLEDAFLLRDYTRTIRQSLVILGAIDDSIRLLSFGTAPMRRANFLSWVRRSEAFWRTYERGLQSV